MRIFGYLFFAFSVCFSIFTILRILLTYSLYDFINGYYPALQDLVAGRGLYDNPAIDINYPPTAFLFFLPFRYLSADLGQKLWTILSFISLVASILLILKSINRLNAFTFLLVYSLAMLSFPVKFTLGMGQINHFVLLLVAAAFYFSVRKNQIAAGIALGVAITIKLTPVFLLFYFLKKNNYRIIIITMITILSITMTTGVLFGWELFGQYFFDIIPTLPIAGNDIYYNQSLTGFLARLDVPNQIAVIVNYIVLFALLAISYRITRSEKQKSAVEFMEYGLFMIVALASAGLAWQHHFVYLLIPFTALYLDIQNQKKQKFFRILLVIMYLLIAMNLKSPDQFTGILSLLLSHVFYGTVLLWLTTINILANQLRHT